MKITLHTMLGLKQALGQRQIEIELPQGSTLEGLFACMKERWGAKLAPHLYNPGDETIHSHLRILVNGQSIQFLNGIDTPLKDGDDVAILPLISGG